MPSDLSHVCRNERICKETFNGDLTAEAIEDWVNSVKRNDVVQLGAGNFDALVQRTRCSCRSCLVLSTIRH